MKTSSRILSFVIMRSFYSMANASRKKMKSRLFLLSIVSMLFLFFVPLCNAELMNGGFETGDISGWSLRSEGGDWKHRVLDSNNNWNEQNVTPSQALLEQIGFFQYFSPHAVTYSWFGKYSPTEGQYFLKMQNADAGGTAVYFNQNQPYGSEYAYLGNSTLFLEQSFFMEKGDILSGMAAFATGDEFPFGADRAEVKINKTTIWTKGALDVYKPTYENWSEWESWSWIAPESNTYTISLMMLTDDDLGSLGMFDNIKITHVPEPASMLLLGIGLIGLVGLRKIFKI